MATESELPVPRVLLAVDDEVVRERLHRLMDSAELVLEVVPKGRDPLQEDLSPDADLLVLRRDRLEERDLRRIDAYTRGSSGPGVVVLTEETDGPDRARLMAAGVASVLETSDTNEDLRESLEAIAEAEHDGSSRGPHSPGEEPRPRLADFLSRSPRMKRFLDLVQRVVDTDSSLLITGETGVGKERLAQAIHEEGARAGRPFVSVNCGAIPEQLLESELFGHEAGAFTGAGRMKRGRFEQADGGTIFLDEIGEMPSHLQVTLLTVLQRRRVQRVGSETVTPVDVRVMAATNREVIEEVEKGRFREDLYYRLNVVPLDVPALRERPEDIPELAGKFISHFRVTLGRSSVESISDEALEALVRYPWPGNVRELVNAIEHAVVLCRSSTITLPDLPDTVAGRLPEAGPAGSAAVEAPSTPCDAWSKEASLFEVTLREARNRVGADFERAYLHTLLTKSDGRVGETARLAGITPRSLYGKMKRHGLRKENYR